MFAHVGIVVREVVDERMLISRDRYNIGVEYGQWMICACLVSFMPVSSLLPLTAFFFIHLSVHSVSLCKFSRR